MAGRLRYPKFLLLLLTFVVAYAIFSGRDISLVQEFIFGLGYAGSFLSGMLYSYGFTAGPATALLLIMAKQQNIFISALVAGIGSLFTDLVIFKLIRHSFMDEVRRLYRERLVAAIRGRTPGGIKKYMLPVIAAVIIASPLPDEIGVSMLAMSTHRTRTFCLVSYLLNTAGIFVILLTGNAF